MFKIGDLICIEQSYLDDVLKTTKERSYYEDFMIVLEEPNTLKGFMSCMVYLQIKCHTTNLANLVNRAKKLA